jgi:signal transduction histidine kinase
MESSISSKSDLLTKSFLLGLNFELKTLLNGFVGPVQLLKYKLEDPELVDIFRMLDSSISRLERLALRTSIMQTPKPLENYSFEKLSIVDVVKYAILDLQTLLDIENVKFNIASNIQPIASVNGNFNLLLQGFEILFEIVISLSSENSTIDVDFKQNSNKVVCTVTSETAQFPSEFNLPLSSIKITNDASWDLLLAKIILAHHLADVSIIDSLKPNTLAITFNID